MFKDKWLFFDCYGVIFPDVSELWMEKYHLTPEQRTAIRKKVYELGDIGQISVAEQFNIIEQISGIKTSEIKKEWEKTEKEDKKILELIKKLRADYHVALLSNASANSLRPTLKRIGADTSFDKIFISSEMKVKKPDPKIFLAALKQCNCEPQNATMIDDRQINIDGAKSVGMNGILYTGIEKLIRQLQDV